MKLPIWSTKPWSRRDVDVYLSIASWLSQLPPSKKPFVCWPLIVDCYLSITLANGQVVRISWLRRYISSKTWLDHVSNVSSISRSRQAGQELAGITGVLVGKAFWNFGCSIIDCYTGTSNGRLDCLQLGFNRPCLETSLTIAAIDWTTSLQLRISLSKRYGAGTWHRPSSVRPAPGMHIRSHPTHGFQAVSGSSSLSQIRSLAMSRDVDPDASSHTCPVSSSIHGCSSLIQSGGLRGLRLFNSSTDASACRGSTPPCTFCRMNPASDLTLVCCLLHPELFLDLRGVVCRVHDPVVVVVRTGVEPPSMACCLQVDLTSSFVAGDAQLLAGGVQSFSCELQPSYKCRPGCLALTFVSRCTQTAQARIARSAGSSNVRCRRFFTCCRQTLVRRVGCSSMGRSLCRAVFVPSLVDCILHRPVGLDVLLWSCFAWPLLHPDRCGSLAHSA